MHSSLTNDILDKVYAKLADFTRGKDYFYEKYSKDSGNSFL